MTESDAAALARRLLDLAAGEQATSSRGAAVAAHRWLRPTEASAAGEPSLEQLAAFADGALDEAELRDMHRALADSPTWRDEVMDALDFLDAVKIRRDALAPPLPETVLSTADLSAFLAGDRALSTAQQRLLFRNPVLRAELTRLKQLAAAPPNAASAWRPRYEMPALAAAASGELTRRRFTGGEARIGMSPDGDAMLIELTLDVPEHPPRALLLEGVDERIALSRLPPPRRDGTILLMKDPDDEAAALFVALLRDPRSVGTFLQ